MRSFLMVVAAAALVAAGSPAARAQGEFPLKYVMAAENDPLLNSGMSYSGGMTEQPKQIKALPQGLSGSLRFFAIPVGGKPYWGVLDNTSPPKLYVDAAGTGDLSTVTPLVGKVSGSQCRYGPIEVPIGSGKSAVAAKVLFVSIGNNQILGGRAAGYMAGEVKLDGQMYRVAIVDKNLDGRYEGALRADGSSVPWWMADTIAIDSNQDGKFAGGGASPEIMPLAKAVRVKEAYYRVQLAPDGSSIKADKYEPKMGTLDVGAAATVMFMSDTGVCNLSGSDGKWQVPEGTYACGLLSLVKADADGKQWSLSSIDMGGLKKFEVRGGETAVFKIGPPLALKADAGEPEQGQIPLNLLLVGKGGETYSLAIRTGAAQPPPPQIKIFDASGKVLAEGNLEYG